MWGLELCDEKLYAFKKYYKARIPTCWHDRSDVAETGILFFTLNVSENVRDSNIVNEINSSDTNRKCQNNFPIKLVS